MGRYPSPHSNYPIERRRNKFSANQHRVCRDLSQLPDAERLMNKVESAIDQSEDYIQCCELGGEVTSSTRSQSRSRKTAVRKGLS